MRRLSRPLEKRGEGGGQGKVGGGHFCFCLEKGKIYFTILFLFTVLGSRGGGGR